MDAFTGGSLLIVLGIGFVLGLKHATDADHIVAVTTFVGEERSILRACSIGLFWGLGHTLALTTAGLALVALRVPMSRWLAERLELAVAAMLVVLGARTIACVHSRSHAKPTHFRWTRFGVRPLLVGIVHGAAGSAALSLLVLSTLSSPFYGVLYILIFGAGSIAGMLAISLLLTLPMHWARAHVATASRPIQIAAGVFSCCFGVRLGISVWQGLS